MDLCSLISTFPRFSWKRGNSSPPTATLLMIWSGSQMLMLMTMTMLITMTWSVQKSHVICFATAQTTFKIFLIQHFTLSDYVKVDGPDNGWLGFNSLEKQATIF